MDPMAKQGEESFRTVHINQHNSHEYGGNKTRTSKYTVFTFLPKALFEQVGLHSRVYAVMWCNADAWGGPGRTRARVVACKPSARGHRHLRNSALAQGRCPASSSHTHKPCSSSSSMQAAGLFALGCRCHAHRKHSTRQPIPARNTYQPASAFASVPPSPARSTGEWPTSTSPWWRRCP